MKKYLLMFALLCGASSMMFTSCLGDQEAEDLIDDEATLARYRKDIVGLWLENDTEEYWRFKNDGSGSKATPSTGKYWDEADDMTESEAESFQWYIETTGLMVIHAIGGTYNDPDPEAPFKIESLTASKMVWKGSDGTYHEFTRQK